MKMKGMQNNIIHRHTKMKRGVDITKGVYTKMKEAGPTLVHVKMDVAEST